MMMNPTDDAGEPDDPTDRTVPRPRVAPPPVPLASPRSARGSIPPPPAVVVSREERAPIEDSSAFATVQFDRGDEGATGGGAPRPPRDTARLELMLVALGAALAMLAAYMALRAPAHPEVPTVTAAPVPSTPVPTPAPPVVTAPVAPPLAVPAPVVVTPGHIALAITSRPAHATVTLVDPRGVTTVLGKTPATAVLDATHSYDLVIAANGYATQIRHVAAGSTAPISIDLAHRAPTAQSHRHR